MLELLGAFLFFGLLTRLAYRIPLGPAVFRRRALAVNLSIWAITVALSAYGNANGGPPAWRFAFTMQTLPAMMWLILDLYRGRAFFSAPTGQPIPTEDE